MRDTRTAFTTTLQPAPHKRAPASLTNKSRVTNGRWILQGIDNRSPQGRRFRDLCNAFEAEIGGHSSETEKCLIRHAAAIAVRAEAQQAAIIAGKDISADSIIRLTSEARRLIEAINVKAGKRAAAKSGLDAYLARGGAE